MPTIKIAAARTFLIVELCLPEPELQTSASIQLADPVPRVEVVDRRLDQDTQPGED
jgi:hypothetical protein